MENIRTLIFAFLFFSLFCSFSGQTIKAQNSDEIKILSTDYYSICNCNEKSPVLVRITFSFNRSDLQNFKMIQKYEGDIIKTINITEKDKKGNPVYDFCTTTDKSIEFTTYFIGIDGAKTNEILIKTDIKNAKIINGTPPLILQVN
jgi:hypothetical protein